MSALQGNESQKVVCIYLFPLQCNLCRKRLRFLSQLSEGHLFKDKPLQKNPKHSKTPLFYKHTLKASCTENLSLWKWTNSKESAYFDASMVTFGLHGLCA